MMKPKRLPSQRAEPMGSRTERARVGGDASDSRRPTPSGSVIEEQRSEVSVSMKAIKKPKNATITTAKKVLSQMKNNSKVYEKNYYDRGQ